MKPEKKQKAAKTKKKFCVQSGCKAVSVSEGYCRLHYLANWKHIKFNDKVKAERRLNAYVDRLAKKYPQDYLEIIREGLEDEGKFKKTMEELDLHVESDDPQTEEEFLEKFMRGIKGME